MPSAIATPSNQQRETSNYVIARQFFTRCSAVRHASACDGERRIARAARAHHRRAEDAEVRHLVREAPAVDDVGLGVVAHARAAVGVRRRRPSCRRPAPRWIAIAPAARYHCSILSWMNARDPPLVVLVVGGDAAHREAERILHRRIEIEVVVLVRQRRLLQVRRVRAVGVLLDERLPLPSPSAARGRTCSCWRRRSAGDPNTPTGCRRR